MSTAKNYLIQMFHPRVIKERIIEYVLRGKGVECVCCQRAYITFLPAGMLRRANAKCPHCGSLERHRAMWLFLKQYKLLSGNNIKLLHVAPEMQFYLQFSKEKNIAYHPVDLNPGNYRYGSKTEKMDITALTYNPDFFDAVICNHVLEHVPDDKKALREIFRVMKKGGWALLNVPLETKKEKTFEDPSITEPQKRKEIFGQSDHVRIYGMDYIMRLQEAGFTVNVIDFTAKFSAAEQFKYGLQKDELIFYCEKK